MWNVKVITKKLRNLLTRDLIDTLWNVKESDPRRYAEEAPDLIDTLWNVKMSPSKPVRNKEIRFNRYIVECKGKSSEPKLLTKL